ncbi:MAG: GFA family protein, partial [Myxococcota bacterium]
MVTGSCLCGGIRIQAERVALLRHCHCSMCRKETGSAFGTVAVVRPSDFRFERGEELVQIYRY